MSIADWDSWQTRTWQTYYSGLWNHESAHALSDALAKPKEICATMLELIKSTSNISCKKVILH